MRASPQTFLRGELRTGGTEVPQVSDARWMAFVPRPARNAPGLRISLRMKGLRVIRGERIYLRSIERDDLERCHDWMNDEDLRSTLAQRYPISLAREADWVERATRGQDPSEMTFAICLAEGDRHVGNCGLM